MDEVLTINAGQKKMQDISNAAGAKPALYVQRRGGSNNLYTQIPNLPFKGPEKSMVEGKQVVQTLLLKVETKVF